MRHPRKKVPSTQNTCSMNACGVECKLAYWPDFGTRSPDLNVLRTFNSIARLRVQSPFVVAGQQYSHHRIFQSHFPEWTKSPTQENKVLIADMPGVHNRKQSLPLPSQHPYRIDCSISPQPEPGRCKKGEHIFQGLRLPCSCLLCEVI